MNARIKRRLSERYGTLGTSLCSLPRQGWLFAISGPELFNRPHASVKRALARLRESVLGARGRVIMEVTWRWIRQNVDALAFYEVARTDAPPAGVRILRISDTRALIVMGDEAGVEDWR
jgi:hypothetical protein